MRLKSKVQNPKSDARQRRLFYSALIILCFCFSGCIKSLESPECTQARDTIKKFYSYHLDSLIHPDAESVREREEFLTDELKQKMPNEAANDYFTQTMEDFPKAFRVGECQTIAPDRVAFEVLLFWKTDTRTEERRIMVGAAKENEKWLVDKVSLK